MADEKEIVVLQAIMAELLRGLNPNAVNVLNSKITADIMVCMGIDAMRIALGQPTKNYPAATVIQYLIVAAPK